MLEKGREADVWLINSSGVQDIDDILRKDRRYALFSALKNRRVYNNDLREEGFGNPYWDEGYVYPDRILSDLVKILYPAYQGEENSEAAASGRNNDPQFHYFRRLK